jgi:hypothetical protein
MTAFWGLALFLVSNNPGKTPSDSIMAFLFVGVIFVVNLLVAIEVIGSKIMFDHAEIVSCSPWQPRRIIPWPEFTTWSYSTFTCMFVFRTSSHGLIRVSKYMNGVQEFISEMETRRGRRGTA